MFCFACLIDCFSVYALCLVIVNWLLGLLFWLVLLLGVHLLIVYCEIMFLLMFGIVLFEFLNCGFIA